MSVSEQSSVVSRHNWAPRIDLGRMVAQPDRDELPADRRAGERADSVDSSSAQPTNAPALGAARGACDRRARSAGRQVVSPAKSIGHSTIAASSPRPDGLQRPRGDDAGDRVQATVPKRSAIDVRNVVGSARAAPDGVGSVRSGMARQQPAHGGLGRDRVQELRMRRTNTGRS